jgi:hypothetical protein
MQLEKHKFDGHNADYFKTHQKKWDALITEIPHAESIVK